MQNPKILNHPKTEASDSQESKKVFAVLLAAGSSTRFGSDKLNAKVQETPLWIKSYRALLESPCIHAVGIVTTSDKVVETIQKAPEAKFVIPGGSSRQQSSKFGTQAVPPEFDIVLIHDAARPFVSEQVIFNVIQGVKTDHAAYPVVKAVDTWREIDPQTEEVHLLNRDNLFAAQTPQGATRQLLLNAHNQATEEFTDEAALIQSAGTTPLPVPGDPQNIKVTNPSDLQPHTKTTLIRTGLGYDIHSFSSDPNRPLWLGGVEFEDDKPGLEGHSDADALLHAIVDALLGAISAGDIGVHYQNTDPRWHNCPSIHFLKETAQLLNSQGWTIANIDATVVAERPKVMQKSQEIINSIAAATNLEPNQVSIKATTNEKLGAIGRSEGIAAFAIATVTKNQV